MCSEEGMHPARVEQLKRVKRVIAPTLSECGLTGTDPATPELLEYVDEAKSVICHEMMLECLWDIRGTLEEILNVQYDIHKP